MNFFNISMAAGGIGPSWCNRIKMIQKQQLFSCNFPQPLNFKEHVQNCSKETRTPKKWFIGGELQHQSAQLWVTGRSRALMSVVASWDRGPNLIANKQNKQQMMDKPKQCCSSRFVARCLVVFGVVTILAYIEWCSFLFQLFRVVAVHQETLSLNNGILLKKPVSHDSLFCI